MQDSTGVTIEVTLPQALLFDTGVTPEEAGARHDGKEPGRATTRPPASCA